MMQMLNARDIDAGRLIPLAIDQNDAVDAQVRAIVDAVRREGDAALLRYTERFDGARLDAIAVGEEEIERAYAAADPDFIQTLTQSAANIRAFHERQVRNSFVTMQRDGVLLGQKITPLSRVGLYVPGGTAAYPSTVLMDAIPAQIAGVEEIIIATPPGRDGRVNEDVLTAARVLGVGRILRIGGAQAVAAMAYGTRSVPRVDKIVGPGNIYVATAKRMVYGLVDIDMIAGPSEILIIAEGGCNPVYIAADLLSQAEHDPLASAILVTTSEALATAVQAEVERQIPLTPRADICRASIDANGRIILCDTLDEAAAISNAIAPEHLELCVEDPFGLMTQIRNAGSIFLGRHVPEALGDYFAGPNHTLPTSGTARFSSPLSVDDFIKKSSFIYYTKDALAKVQRRVVDFARREGLYAHGQSVSVRFEEADA